MWIKDHISYSQINAFYNYRQDFINTYVLKLEFKPNDYVTFGQNFSKVIDDYVKTGSYTKLSNANYLGIIAQIENTFDIHSGNTEVFFQTQVTGIDVPFLGYIDWLSDDKSLLLDFKTGKVWSEQDMLESKQLLLYAGWVYTTTGRIPEVGIVNLPCTHYAGLVGLQFTGDVIYRTYKPTQKCIEEAIQWLRQGYKDATNYLEQNYSNKSAFKDELIKKYIRAKAKLEEYKSLEEEYRKALTDLFLETQIDRYDAYEGHKFALQNRVSYKYSEAVEQLEEQLKNLKKHEVEKGIAQVDKSTQFLRHFAN